MMHYAVLGGVCASLGSLFGKMCGLSFLEQQLILKVLCFALMIFCNGSMWTFYSKALQYSESSLSPTVICAASNYLCSALWGFFIFDEVTSLLWWSGTFLILTGLVLIIKDNPPKMDTMETGKKAR